MESAKKSVTLYVLTLLGFVFSAGLQLAHYFAKHFSYNDPVSKYVLFSGSMYLATAAVMMLFRKKKPVLLVFIPLYAYICSSELFWYGRGSYISKMQFLVLACLIISGHCAACVYMTRIKSRLIRGISRCAWFAALILQTVLSVILAFHLDRYLLSKNLLSTAWVYMILITMCQSIKFIRRRYDHVSRVMMFIPSLLVLAAAISAYGLGSKTDPFLTTTINIAPYIVLAVTFFLYSLWIHQGKSD